MKVSFSSENSTVRSTPLFVSQTTGEDARPWRPATIAAATTPEPQESVSPSTPRSQVRTWMRLSLPARTKLALAPSGIAGWCRTRGPSRSMSIFERSPRMKTTRWGTPIFIGIAVGGRPLPEIGTGSDGAGTVGSASVTLSPSTRAAMGPQPVSSTRLGPAARPWRTAKRAAQRVPLAQKVAGPPSELR